MLRLPTWWRLTASISLFLILPTTFISSAKADVEYSPFSNPLLDRDYEQPNHAAGALIKRASCPSNYDSCSSVGDSGICCPSNNICTYDSASQIACCPTGATCTGTLGSATTVSTTSSQSTSSSSSGIVVVGSSASSAATTGSVSTISGAAYPFVYIPTSYSNAQECSSWYTECQYEYVSCTSYLGSGVTGNAVTISGVTGVVTAVGATTTVPTQSASSYCSSLSQEACYGLQLADCSQFGTATTTGGATTVTIVSEANAVPRVTGCLGGVYAMGAGVALGVVRGLV